MVCATYLLYVLIESGTLALLASRYLSFCCVRKPQTLPPLLFFINYRVKHCGLYSHPRLLYYNSFSYLPAF